MSAVLLVFVGVLALYAFCAVIWAWPLPFRDSTLKRKLREARNLAREIGIWADKKLLEHSSTNTIHLGMLDEDRNVRLSGRKFEEEARRRAIQSVSLIDMWNRQYSIDALHTYDFLVNKGAPQPAEGRLLFERPVNIGQIAAIARELGVMAAHLEVR